MKINKSAWHYELITEGLFWLDGQLPSRSLCVYFWQVVWMLLKGVGVAMLVASPLVALAWSVAGYSPEALLMLVPYVVWAYIGATCLAMAVIFVFAGTVVLICEGVKLMVKKIGIKKSSSSPTSLVYNYIKAKKDKICPIIDFEG